MESEYGGEDWDHGTNCVRLLGKKGKSHPETKIFRPNTKSKTTKPLKYIKHFFVNSWNTNSKR